AGQGDVGQPDGLCGHLRVGARAVGDPGLDPTPGKVIAVDGGARGRRPVVRRGGGSGAAGHRLVATGATGQQRKHRAGAGREGAATSHPRGSRTSFAAFTGSVWPSPYAGHSRATGQAPQAGLRAWQRRRPCQMTWWHTITQSFFGNSAPTSASTVSGSVLVVQPNRRASRPKWVSTVMPGTPKALPSTTLAVLRPTPGSFTSSARVRGTSPSCSVTSCWPSLSRVSVLARKNPVGRISSSSSARSAATRCCGVGYRGNSVAVTAFTRLSVDWADRTVATSNWYGLVKSSSVRASG